MNIVAAILFWLFSIAIFAAINRRDNPAYNAHIYWIGGCFTGIICTLLVIFGGAK